MTQPTTQPLTWLAIDALIQNRGATMLHMVKSWREATQCDVAAHAADISAWDARTKRHWRIALWITIPILIASFGCMVLGLSRMKYARDHMLPPASVFRIEAQTFGLLSLVMLGATGLALMIYKLMQLYRADKKFWRTPASCRDFFRALEMVTQCTGWSLEKYATMNTSNVREKCFSVLTEIARRIVNARDALNRASASGDDYAIINSTVKAAEHAATMKQEYDAMRQLGLAADGGYARYFAAARQPQTTGTGARESP